MTNSLTFDAAKVAAEIAIVKAAKSLRLSYADTGKPKPSLWLVGDDGVYLMGNHDRAQPPPFDVIYANECNPKTMPFDDWWAVKRATFGGDDGCEVIPVKDIEPLLLGAKTLKITFLRNGRYRITGVRPESVTRYVITYINKNGERTLIGPAQGRFTFATAADAEDHLKAITGNNSSSSIRDVWGDNPRFEVRPCPCYPGHFDPQTVWFDEPERAP